MRTRRAARFRMPTLRLALPVALLTLSGTAGTLLASQDVEVARVVRGNVRVQADDGVTNVHASNNSIINFRRFGVAAGNQVHFIQPGRSARALARVTGGSMSRIDGTLTSTGTLYLVNRAGIVFGPNSTVSAGALHVVAGDLRNRDFIRGVDRFTLSKDGLVSNLGSIEAHGSLSLIGANVYNGGTILSNSGLVTFASGERVFVGEEGSTTVVEVSNSKAATPAGQAAIVNDGSVSGRSVRFEAADVLGAAMMNRGSVRASASVRMAATSGDVSHTGSVTAHTPGGGATSSVDIATGPDSRVRIAGDVTAPGGSITITGGDLTLDAGVIDASSSNAGGVIRIGGDLRGGGTLPTSDSVTIAEEVRVLADALVSGDGGRVIVYSDGRTEISGAISARGGALGGDGGFVETSGRHAISFDAAPNITTAGGEAGTWLIDPRSIVISDDPSAGMGGGGAFSPGDVTVIDPSVLLDGLMMGNVEIVTPDDLSGLPGGDITLLSALDFTGIRGQRTLTLSALRDISLEAGISSAGALGESLSLVLDAGRDIAVTKSLDLNGGSLFATGRNIAVSAPTVDTGGVRLVAQGDVTLGGLIRARLAAAPAMGIGPSAGRSPGDISVVSGLDGLGGSIALNDNTSLVASTIGLDAGGGFDPMGDPAGAASSIDFGTGVTFGGADALTDISLRQNASAAFARRGGEQLPALVDAAPGLVYTIESRAGSLSIERNADLGGGAVTLLGADGVSLTSASREVGSLTIGGDTDADGAGDVFLAGALATTTDAPLTLRGANLDAAGATLDTPGDVSALFSGESIAFGDVSARGMDARFVGLGTRGGTSTSTITSTGLISLSEGAAFQAGSLNLTIETGPQGIDALASDPNGSIDIDNPNGGLIFTRLETGGTLSLLADGAIFLNNNTLVGNEAGRAVAVDIATLGNTTPAADADLSINNLILTNGGAIDLAIAGDAVINANGATDVLLGDVVVGQTLTVATAGSISNAGGAGVFDVANAAGFISMPTDLAIDLDAGTFVDVRGIDTPGRIDASAANAGAAGLVLSGAPGATLNIGAVSSDTTVQLFARDLDLVGGVGSVVGPDGVTLAPNEAVTLALGEQSFIRGGFMILEQSDIDAVGPTQLLTIGDPAGAAANPVLITGDLTLAQDTEILALNADSLVEFDIDSTLTIDGADLTIRTGTGTENGITFGAGSSLVATGPDLDGLAEIDLIANSMEFAAASGIDSSNPGGALLRLRASDADRVVRIGGGAATPGELAISEASLDVINADWANVIVQGDQVTIDNATIASPLEVNADSTITLNSGATLSAPSVTLRTPASLVSGEVIVNGALELLEFERGAEATQTITIDTALFSLGPDGVLDSGDNGQLIDIRAFDAELAGGSITGQGDLRFTNTRTALSFLLGDSPLGRGTSGFILDNAELAAIDSTFGEVRFTSALDTQVGAVIGGAVFFPGATGSPLVFDFVGADATIDIVGSLEARGLGASLTFNNPVNLGAAINAPGNAVDFNAPVTLTANSAVTSTNPIGTVSGDITFADTVDGGFDLTLDSGDENISFNGPVGTTTRLGDVTVTRANFLSLNDDFFANTFAQIDGTGLTAITSTLDLTGNPARGVTQDTLFIRTNFLNAGGATFNIGSGDVTLLANVIIFPDAINAGGGIVTVSNLNPDNSIGVGSAAGDLQISNAELAVISADEVRIGDVDLTGALTLQNVVLPASGGRLTLVRQDGLAIDVIGDVTTSDRLAFGLLPELPDHTNGVFLGNAGDFTLSTLGSGGGADIVVTGGIDTAGDTGASLTLDAGAGAIALNTIGTTSPLANLTIDSASALTVGGVVAGPMMGQPGVTGDFGTGAGVSIGGPAVFDDTVNVGAMNLAADDITFNGRLIAGGFNLDALGTIGFLAGFELGDFLGSADAPTITITNLASTSESTLNLNGDVSLLADFEGLENDSNLNITGTLDLGADILNPLAAVDITGDATLRDGLFIVEASSLDVDGNILAGGPNSALRIGVMNTGLMRGDIGTPEQRLASLEINADRFVFRNTEFVGTTGDQTYNVEIELFTSTGGSTITFSSSQEGTIAFNDRLFGDDGVESVVVESGGDKFFNGGVDNLDSLISGPGMFPGRGDTGGSMSIVDGDIDVNTFTFKDRTRVGTTLSDLELVAQDGNARFEAPVTFGPASYRVAANGAAPDRGNVFFLESVTSNGDMTTLSLDAENIVLLRRDVTGFGGLDVAAGEETRIGRDVIVGDARFDGPVLLSLGNHTIEASTGNLVFGDELRVNAGTTSIRAGEDIEFGGPINGVSGAPVLDIFAGFDVSFLGPVGGLGSLVVGADGEIFVVTGFIDEEGLERGGPMPFVISSGDITFNADLNLFGGPVIIEATNAGDAGFVRFNAGITGATDLSGNITDLAINAPGDTSFFGDVADLASLVTDAPGRAVFGVSPFALGPIPPARSIGADTATINDVAVISFSDVTFDVASDLTFNQTVTGTGLNALTLNAAGNTRFFGTVSELGLLMTDAPGATLVDRASDMDPFTDILVGEIAIGDDLTVADGDSRLIARLADATFGGSATFGAGNYTVVARQNVRFNDATSFGLGNATIEAAGGELRFGSTADFLDGDRRLRGLTDTVFVGDASFGNGTTLVQARTGDATFMASSAFGTSGSAMGLGTPGDYRVVAAGDATFSGPSFFGDGVSLVSAGNDVLFADETTFAVGTFDVNADNDVTFLDRWDLGGGVFTVNAFNATFQGLIADRNAGGDALDPTQEAANLSVNAFGTTAFNGGVSLAGALSTDAPGQTQVNSNIGVSTFTFNDPTVVQLGGFQVTAQGDGTFNATSTFASGNRNVTSLAGNVFFNDTATFNAGLYTVNAAQDAIFSSMLVNAPVITGSPVNSNLAINVAGTTNFNGDVRDLFALTSDAPGTVRIGGDITNLNTLTLNDTGGVFLDVAPTINAETIFIEGLVDGQSNSLTIDGANDTTLVSGYTAIDTLDSSDVGTTFLGGDGSSNVAMFDNDLSLLNSVTITADDSAVFEGLIDGQGNTLTVESNLSDFNGGGANLAALTVDPIGAGALARFVGTYGIGGGGADINVPVVLDGDTTLNVTGNAAFADTITGAGADFTANVGGTSTFDGSITGFDLLTLDSNAVVFNATDIGADEADVDVATTFTATAPLLGITAPGGIDFNGDLVSNNRTIVALNSAGDTVVTGDLGNEDNPLGGLNTDAAGQTRLIGDVYVAVGQSVLTEVAFNDPTTLDGDIDIVGDEPVDGADPSDDAILRFAQEATLIDSDINVDVSLGRVQFDDTLTLAGDRVNITLGGIDSAGVFFASDVDSMIPGATSLAVNVSTETPFDNQFVDRDVMADTRDTLPVIVFGESVGANGALDELFLNTEQVPVDILREFIPQVATIYAGRFDLVDFGPGATSYDLSFLLEFVDGAFVPQPVSFNAETFAMGFNEKLTSLGELAINAGGSAYVGDLAAFGDLSVVANAELPGLIGGPEGDIYILERGRGLLRQFAFDGPGSRNRASTFVNADGSVDTTIILQTTVDEGDNMDVPIGTPLDPNNVLAEARRDTGVDFAALGDELIFDTNGGSLIVLQSTTRDAMPQRDPRFGVANNRFTSRIGPFRVRSIRGNFDFGSTSEDPAFNAFVLAGDLFTELSRDVVLDFSADGILGAPGNLEFAVLGELDDLEPVGISGNLSPVIVAELDRLGIDLRSPTPQDLADGLSGRLVFNDTRSDSTPLSTFDVIPASSTRAFVKDAAAEASVTTTDRVLERATTRFLRALGRLEESAGPDDRGTSPELDFFRLAIEYVVAGRGVSAEAELRDETFRAQVFDGFVDSASAEELTTIDRMRQALALLVNTGLNEREQNRIINALAGEAEGELKSPLVWAGREMLFELMQRVRQGEPLEVATDRPAVDEPVDPAAPDDAPAAVQSEADEPDEPVAEAD